MVDFCVVMISALCNGLCNWQAVACVLVVCSKETHPLRGRADILPARWVDLVMLRLHSPTVWCIREGGGGPPVRLAEVYFPTGINLDQCSRPHRADSWSLAAQTLVMKYLW